VSTIISWMESRRRWWTRNLPAGSRFGVPSGQLAILWDRCRWTGGGPSYKEDLGIILCWCKSERWSHSLRVHPSLFCCPILYETWNPEVLLLLSLGPTCPSKVGPAALPTLHHRSHAISGQASSSIAAHPNKEPLQAKHVGKRGMRR